MEMGRGEESMRCMERVTWKLTLPFKIDSQWEFAVWLRNSNRGSVSTHSSGMGREMGEKFKREGIHVYLWLIHVEV